MNESAPLKAASADASTCANITADDTYQAKVAQLILASADTTEFELLFGSSAGFQVMLETLDGYVSKGSFSGFDPGAMIDYFSATAGSSTNWHEGYFSGGKINTTAVNTMHDLFGAINWEGMTAADRLALAGQLGGQVKTAGWDTFQKAGDAWGVAFYQQYQQDPTGGTLNSFRTNNKSAIENQQTCVEQQQTLGVTNPSTIQSACFGSVDFGTQGDLQQPQQPQQQQQPSSFIALNNTSWSDVNTANNNCYLGSGNNPFTITETATNIFRVTRGEITNMATITISGSTGSNNCSYVETSGSVTCSNNITCTATSIATTSTCTTNPPAGCTLSLQKQ